MPDDIVLGEDAHDFRQKCFAMYDLFLLTSDLLLISQKVTPKSDRLQRSSENIPISCSHLIGNLLDSLNQTQERSLTTDFFFYLRSHLLRSVYFFFLFFQVRLHFPSQLPTPIHFVLLSFLLLAVLPPHSSTRVFVKRSFTIPIV